MTNQIEKALKELDLTDVAFKLSQMALKIISGKKIEEKTYSVPVSIPIELADVLELLSNSTNIKVEDMIGHMAREGFNTSLKNRIAQEQKPKQKEDELSQLAKASGFDMSNLQNKMNEFTTMVGKLQDLQKVVENVNTATSTKNSQQPNLSPSTIPCPGERKE